MKGSFPTSPSESGLSEPDKIADHYPKAAYAPLAAIANKAQSGGMSISAILPFAIALSFGALPAQDPHAYIGFYGASVTFREGECWFWTGDVGLTARQFEQDLKDRFDRKRGIVISYVANTPARCIERARRSASRAGFTTVKLVVNADAGPIGPPSNGS